MSKIWVLLLFSFSLMMGMAYTLLQRNAPALPVETKIYSSNLIPSNFYLKNLSLGGTGTVYGSLGNKLYRVVEQGQDKQQIHRFSSTISAIHERDDGLLVVATDDDHWDPQKPCRIYRSSDAGETFDQVKTKQGGGSTSLVNRFRPCRAHIPRGIRPPESWDVKNTLAIRRRWHALARDI